jgi:solute:Na+ symporter, SSS family
MIAFVKDIMIYIVVIAAVWLIPLKLGGYAHVFDSADQFFQAKGGATGIILKPAQFTAYASLALGSALAAFMYPHTMTAVLSSSSATTVRKNAIFLPAYTLLLGLIALLGYMAIAAGVHVKSASDVVPTLFGTLFPSWFVGFAAAAIAISALVPAAIMSIGSANLFTRNLWRPLVSPDMSPAAEASCAKLVSLVVKFGALLFIVFLPTQYAIDLQLLGGVWILQIFPAIVFTLYTRRLTTPGLFVGWLVGIVLGTSLAISQGLKPVFVVHLGTASWPLYIGIIALVVNIIVTFVVSMVTKRSFAPAV